ncbi:hypothetical protein V202x_31330 [Gimesia aquarii]|uniref:Uncharacterized protein n=1 Tax=Gimesia aquarii TaxID=2527964 RepID=A0A517WWU8_9PLAN|nr:hypothetical protein V202x_31330 [Gimesia aquarii]
MTETPNDQIIDQQSKKICFVFLFSLFGIFGVIFLTNYIVNPYGYYATTIFRP